MNPVLSVVIPVYQVEDYLEKCIHSVISQQPFTEGLVEVILIDDGSVDNSGNICDIFAEKYSNVSVIHQQNSGLSVSRNVGINAAKGKYILFLDSDDYITENSLANVIEKTKSNSDVILCRHITLDANTFIENEAEEKLDREKVTSLKGEDLLKYLITDRLYGWYACKNIVKKEYIVDNNMFFEPGRLFEDALWTPNLIYCSNSTEYLDEPVYVYLINRGGSIVSQVSEKACIDKLNALDHINNFCDEKSMTDNTKMRMLANVSQIYVSVLADSRLLSAEAKKDLLNRAKKYTCCLKYSHQKYKKILYLISKFIGIEGISYILYLRAEYVRKKNKLKYTRNSNR